MTGHDVAQRLKELNLSTDQLAEYLGRHQDEVSGWLTTSRALPLFTDEEMFQSVAGWLVLLVVGAIFGLVIGRSWLRSAPEAAADSA